jgi:hypothetical protein
MSLECEASRSRPPEKGPQEQTSPKKNWTGGDGGDSRRRGGRIQVEFGAAVAQSLLRHGRVQRGRLDPDGYSGNGEKIYSVWSAR